MTDPLTAAPPAGWYADPRAPGNERWWSGAEWTDHLRARPTAFAGLPSAMAATADRNADSAAMMRLAVTSFAFGIGSLALNPLFLASIVAWSRGSQALRAAQLHEFDGYPSQAKTLARWGVWLGVAGIVNGVLLTLAVIVPWIDYLT